MTNMSPGPKGMTAKMTIGGTTESHGAILYMMGFSVRGMKSSLKRTLMGSAIM